VCFFNKIDYNFGKNSTKLSKKKSGKIIFILEKLKFFFF